GGVSQLDDEPADPRTEFLMAAAGPAASLVLALILSLARVPVTAPWGDAILTYLMYVNLAVGVFNLIPGFPLDGGRLLRALIWRTPGDFAGAPAAASRVGRGVAVGLVVLGAWQAFTGSFLSGLWLVLIGLFLRQAASSSQSQATLASALGDLP